jgi:hypothetical protein
MKKIQLHKPLRAIAIALAPLVLSMYSGSLAAEHRDGKKRGHTEKIIRAIAVTGHNHVVGKPVFDWGPPFGTFGFATLGIYNSQGSMPLMMDENTPKSAIVATAVDPNLLASTGVSPEEVDPAWLNIPLRDVPVHYSFGATKQFPDIFAADPAEKAKSAPNFPITLRRWLRASGVAKIECDGDNRSKVVLWMKDLIPNRMYAVWSTLGPSASGTGEVFPSLPVGGVPNIFVTNADGSAVYERRMQFCPLRPETTDRAMLVINVQYHSNHQNYGGINGPPIERLPGSYWIGTVIHNHLQFPINVRTLDAQ